MNVGCIRWKLSGWKKSRWHQTGSPFKKSPARNGLSPRLVWNNGTNFTLPHREVVKWGDSSFDSWVPSSLRLKLYAFWPFANLYMKFTNTSKSTKTFLLENKLYFAFDQEIATYFLYVTILSLLAKDMFSCEN